MKLRFGIWIGLVLILVSCGGEDYVPKPKAYLRLDFPEVTYRKQQIPKAPLAFEVSNLVENIEIIDLASTTESYGINLDYKPLKATMYLTYKAVDGNEKNLNAFLRDAQKLTLEHTKKADEIPRYPYENVEKNVYGLLSEVRGDVASLAQFYVTDSVNHFLTGSLYFKAKPNYDSILPAANYLQKDIQRIMETIEWQ